MSDLLDVGLKQWATDTQARYLDAVNDCGSFSGAAKALGRDQKTVLNSINALKQKAALAGHSPAHDMHHTVPAGFNVKGVSTYYNRDGVAAGQWVKSAADLEVRAQMIARWVEQLVADVPAATPVRPPLMTVSDLCNLYTITDAHVGMLAWREETGADWDLRIAEDTLSGCFDHLVEHAPRARTAVISQLGDFVHSDGLVPVTPAHGNVLDMDGRFEKVVESVIRILQRMIKVALEHHENVIVLLAEGNHDPASSVWLRTTFAALYRDEPRVTVIRSPLPYYVHQHGKTMLAFHHGHLSKNASLPLLFAAQFPVVWGATTKRYAHTGHRHHAEEKEHSGMVVTQHPTLAARDAYASRGGWIAERQATAMTYHAEYGLVARNSVTPEMVR